MSAKYIPVYQEGIEAKYYGADPPRCDFYACFADNTIKRISDNVYWVHHFDYLVFNRGRFESLKIFKPEYVIERIFINKSDIEKALEVSK